MGNYIELNDLADAIKDLRGLIKRSSPVIDLVHCKELEQNTTITSICTSLKSNLNACNGRCPENQRAVITAIKQGLKLQDFTNE